MKYTPKMANLGSVWDIQVRKRKGFNLTLEEIDKELEHERANKIGPA